MKSILTNQTLEIFASVIWKVMLIQTSDESCVITDSFDDFATASFEF